MEKYNIPISACIIAQNEEKYIAKAIENVLPYVGEVVVCDGGSTDNTLSICAKLGCLIYNRPFDYHFANQRNFASSKCNKGWILWADADEYFSTAFLENLSKMITKPNAAAFKVWRKSIFDDELRGEDYQWRLSKKDKTKWVNKIHEDMIVDGEWYYLPKDLYMIHEHTMDKQRWSNALYYNINNGINERPAENIKMEYLDGEWRNV